MKTQIKLIGSKSKGIIIPKDMIKFMELEVGDWVDISDIVKVERKKK